MNLFLKTAAIILCLSCSSVSGFSQQLNWARSIGSPLVEASNTIRTDNAGNVYVAGKFSGSNVDFDPSAATFLLSSVGSTDGFVAKYTPTGQFLWAFRFGGTDKDEVQAINIDQNNNVYVTGYFRGSNIDFDPGAGTTNLTSNGDTGPDPGYGGDIFVAKYDAAGQYQWAFNIGGTELYDSGIAIQTDGAGDVYVGGYFRSAVDFDPSAANTTLNSNNGTIFLAKYTSAGAFQWAFPLGLANDNNSIFDLKTDAAGNVYTVGYFRGTNIDFDPSAASALLSSNGGNEAFVAKYNTNGQYQFAFSLGGTGGDVARGIVLDNAGNMYVLGDFDSPNVDFNPGPATNLLTPTGSSDVFVAKYNALGQYQWAFNFGGAPGEFGWKITSDGNHLYVTGSFSGVADLDPSPAVENIVSSGGLDIFVGKYTLNGEYLCSFKIGSPGNDYGYSIFSSTPNVFYLTGTFTGTNIDFDPTATTVNLSSAGGDDNFLAKYTWPDNVLPAGTISNDVICVGEQAQFTFTATSGTGPFTLVLNNGTTNFTQTNVQSGVPFNITPNPTVTTVYTLVSVKDALRCSETNVVNSTATLTVNECAGTFCNSWLRLPSNPSYVTVGDLDVTGNKLTVEALVNRIPPLNNGLYYGHLISKHTDQTNVNYALQTLGCEMTTDVTGYVALSPTCQPVTNKTYHVAMVYDGATLKFYRNGFLMAQTPVTGNLINNNLLTKIGEVAGPTNPLNNQTIGYTNEVRVWNVARTQAQIRAAMNGPLANPTTQPGLLAYYSFNNLYNKQGNPAFNGTLQGSAVINQINPLCTVAIDSCEIPPPPVVTVDFKVYDSTCVNTPVTITNTSANASSYYWNFCTSNLNAPPQGVNLGNINGAMSSPVFMDYVSDNNNYYGFVTDNTTGRLFRLDFGNSLLNTPAIVNLGTMGGVIPIGVEGIQVIKNEGRWYAIIVGGGPSPTDSRIVKIDFGANITNMTPVGTNWGNLGNLSYPHDLYVFKDNDNWYGLTVNAINNTLTRFSFTNSFSNTPTAVNLGNVGGLSYPTGIQAINDNGNWYAFVMSSTGSTISRLDFGNSLLNTPTGQNLGNPGGLFHNSWDIHIIKYCGELIGYVINANTSFNDIIKLNFGNAITNTPTAVSFGNIGNLNFPHCISKIFRVGSDLYTFIPNVNSQSITRLRFEGCTNASIPNSTAQNPPEITYNTPGIYNINLTIDEGLPTQSSICKQILVKDCGKPISGIINDYTEVLALDACKNSLTVTNASAFNVGDTVMMIQMKGAVVDSSNTAVFGTVTDYKNAGNYEFNYVKSKNGNIIELKNFMVRQYDIPDGKVQLIRVPYYINAVIPGDNVTCLPWDGSKGGVVVLNVQNTLTSINGNGVDANYKGFRGGIDPFSNPAAANCYENQFYYPPNPDLASGKGEGIASISAQKSFGKGALANGGGGGNSHNSGGGGGSNGSAGGFGGYNFELAPCNTTVPFDNRGIGGRALPYSVAANRLFMGGGGGAGHTNNPEGFIANGGNGGGIVIISANIYSTNNPINNIGANSLGMSAPRCPGTDAGCHEGMGGGGAGGTILLNINSFQVGTLGTNTKGGQGAPIDVAGLGRVGPGGGGSGGVTWYKVPGLEYLPPNTSYPMSGGINGVNSEYANDPWGATPGEMGLQLFNLPPLPVTSIPFKTNIDSVRIKDSLTSCRSFDFKGLGYTNTHAIASWQWYFGDGATAASQNTSHVYTNSGPYVVKLVITDINGCKDSVTKQVNAITLDLDFTYQADACNPFSVQFNALGTATQSPYWAFGDATSITGVPDPVHVYPSQSSFIVKYSAGNGVCIDTVTKTINLAVQQANIVFTPDTTICYGATKQLRAETGLGFCWSPVTYLDNPNVANPVTSTPHNITYYYTAQVVTGNNLITNGDFSQGNTGFACAYNYANTNTTEGQYFVGPNPRAWHSGMPACTDHTTGSGNMLLVNGAEQPNVGVWTQTITVQPNTNYAFSAWLEHITIINPASLQFSINGIPVGDIFHASDISCLWQQFYTTWNSGNNTSAVISIINQNLLGWGNDFALDDISFAPITTRRDSVKITVDTAFVKTNEDDIICEGKTVQLNTTGGISYTWTQAATLSDAGSPNPVAAPVVSTQYIVTGTNANGCSAKDTVNITVNPKPNITKSPNKEICKNASVQIFATGGGTYEWTPAATLDDATLSNPTATPLADTRYYVTVTDGNTCTNKDSVDITIRPDPVFTVGSGGSVCEKDSILLTASGGNIYSWQPSSSLNNPGIASPRAAPATTTDYFVTITETTCNISKVLQTSVTVNTLPTVKATKSNDLDCSNDRSQLNATGAASYTWTPAASLSNAGIEDPVARPTTNTQYIVKGTDALGCVNYDSVIVSFLAVNAGGYLMPNAFTPNHDGLNDCYGIKYWGVIRELEFSIFNRWGQRIFFTKDPNACWDGSYKGKMQDIGVYVYMISAKTLCGDAFKKGTFTLAK